MPKPSPAALRALELFPQRLNAFFTEKYYDSGLPDLPVASDFERWREILRASALPVEEVRSLRWRATEFESINWRTVAELLEPLFTGVRLAEAVRIGILFGAISSRDGVLESTHYVQVHELLERWRKETDGKLRIAEVAPDLVAIGFSREELEPRLSGTREELQRFFVTPLAYAVEERPSLPEATEVEGDWGDALAERFEQHSRRVRSRGYRSLEPEARRVFTLCLLDAEVINGGIWQYLFNTGGRYLTDTIVALRAVGAASTANRLKRVCDEFPGKRLPPPRSMRSHLPEEPSAVHEKFDEAYYALRRPPLLLLWKSLQRKRVRKRSGAARSKSGSRTDARRPARGSGGASRSAAR